MRLSCTVMTACFFFFQPVSFRSFLEVQSRYLYLCFGDYPVRWCCTFFVQQMCWNFCASLMLIVREARYLFVGLGFTSR